MTIEHHQAIPDNTPLLIGAGQYTEQLPSSGDGPLNSPVELAARAAKLAIESAGGSLTGSDIDAIATIRLFSDSAPAWACPFGRSDNPPASIARRIGARPNWNIYSNAGGDQPLCLLAEFSGAIARGEIECALLTSTEAIANQRHAQRNSLQPDWNEEMGQEGLDERKYIKRMVTPEELASGMYLPAHWYALIENFRATQQGNTPQQHLQQMAELLAPMSQVAASNPYAFFPTGYSAQELAGNNNGNYPICLPFSKRLVAQDAVNQAAAVVVISAGKARELGIDPEHWILQLGYAEGEDLPLIKRKNPGTSEAMERVFDTAIASAGIKQEDIELIDIYSCFPCAVESARDTLGISREDNRPLTVTGGLPFFGGPGNAYSMHALAEMVLRLRSGSRTAMITANGGMLSKHAALILGANNGSNREKALDFTRLQPKAIDPADIEAVQICEVPVRGEVLSYTVIHERKGDDTAIVLAQTDEGERFLAYNSDAEIVSQVMAASPVGRAIAVKQVDGRNYFGFSTGSVENQQSARAS